MIDVLLLHRVLKKTERPQLQTCTSLNGIPHTVPLVAVPVDVVLLKMTASITCQQHFITFLQCQNLNVLFWQLVLCPVHGLSQHLYNVFLLFERINVNLSTFRTILLSWYLEYIQYIVVVVSSVEGYMSEITFKKSQDFHLFRRCVLIICRVVGDKQALAENVCFIVAHIGTGVYIHEKLSRKPAITPFRCALYSTTGAVIFNYGSLLILANLKHYLPESKAVRAAIGLGVVGYLFFVGSDYLSRVQIHRY